MAVTAPASAVEPANAPAAPKRQCFFARDVNNYAAVDARTVNVRVGVRDVYQLEFVTRCHDIDWSHQIALVARGGSNICTGQAAATVITSDPSGPRRCEVRKVRKLTEAEVAALTAEDRP